MRSRSLRALSDTRTFGNNLLEHPKFFRLLKQILYGRFPHLLGEKFKSRGSFLGRGCHDKALAH